MATVWDLVSQGFTRTDHKVEKSIIWNHSPDNENLQVISLSSVSVSVHLVRFRPPVTFHWSRDRPSLGVATDFDQKIKIMIVTARPEDARAREKISGAGFWIGNCHRQMMMVLRSLLWYFSVHVDY